MNKIIIVNRSAKSNWDSHKLKRSWNMGSRGFIINSMGTDNFPIACAKRIGFKVRSLPDYCSEEVAEHTFILLRDLLIKTEGNIPFGSSCLVIGSEGNIGKKVCELAEKRGLEVLKQDVKLNHSDKDLLKKLSKSKIVFICIPLTKETNYFYNENMFLASRPMKPFVINISGRNRLMNIKDLISAVNRGTISGYAVDEVQTHPILKYHEKVYWTPHVGWKSERSIRKRQELLDSLHEQLKIDLRIMF